MPLEGVCSPSPYLGFSGGVILGSKGAGTTLFQCTALRWQQWNNTDTMVHTVTAGVPGAPRPPAQGGFDSGDIPAGGKWAWRFCNARNAVYFCKTHASQMSGYRVVVAP
jgi:hypothetical protein